MNPCKVTLIALYQFLLFSVTLTAMILILVAEYYFNDSFNNYHSVIDNWKLKPLINLRVAVQCSEYELNFTQYNWPGVDNGCYCGLSASKYLPSFIDGTCNQTFLDYGCLSVYGNEQQTFYRFPDPSEEVSIRICASFDNSSFYHNSPKNVSCEPSQIKCGTNLNTFYCSNSICPLTSLKLNGQSQTFQLTSSYYLSADRSSDSLPIVLGIISEGGGVCWDKSKQHITDGREDFPLMKEHKSHCDTDQNAKLLYQISESKFYAANSMWNYISSLPGYRTTDSFQWGLFYQQYILWNFNCRGDLLSGFKQIGDYNISNKFSFVSLQNICNFLIFGIGFSIIFLIRVFDCCCCESCKVNSSCIYSLQYFCLQFEIFILVIIRDLSNSISDTESILEQVINNQCSDSFVLSKLNETKLTINQEIFTYLDVSFYLILANHILGFFIFIIIIEIECDCLDDVCEKIKELFQCKCLRKKRRNRQAYELKAAIQVNRRYSKELVLRQDGNNQNQSLENRQNSINSEVPAEGEKQGHILVQHFDHPNPLIQQHNDQNQ